MTGSGKTAAFGLPIIETIVSRQGGVQALILCPTRELAIQVSEALHKYGRHKRIETLPIYGGQPYERQLRGLQRGVEIVVGTPGRVMDHMRRGTLHLDNLKFFVLDEADEMLDMGFVDDIEWILQQVPADRQTALFSATMPPRIAELARTYMKDPQRISVRGKEMTVPEVHQIILRNSAPAESRRPDTHPRCRGPDLDDDLLPHQARCGRAWRVADGSWLCRRDAAW